MNDPDFNLETPTDSAARSHPESSAPGNAAPVLTRELVGPALEFSLLCNCGAKHQLRYTETPTDRRLDLIPSAAQTSESEHPPIRAIRGEELQNILFGEDSSSVPLPETAPDNKPETFTREEVP